MSVELTSTRQRVKLASSRSAVALTSTRGRTKLVADRQGRPGDTGATGAAGVLNDLTDVTITAAAAGDIVRYNGTAWVDYPDSNYAAASHTHATKQDAVVAVYGAAVGVTGNQTIPTGTSTVLVLGALSGNVTMPSSAASNGQRLMIVNQSGSDLTVYPAAGGDSFPLNVPTTSVTLATGDARVYYPDPFGVGYWLPGVLSGPSTNIPFWLGQSYPDGYVVAMSSGSPAWVDPVDVSQQDPPWNAEPTVTTKVMRLDYAGNPGNTDGAWSTPEPATLSSGVDIRARIWFDYPSDVNPTGGTDRYMEVITQEHPTAGGGDTFEAAILWADDTFGTGVVEGQPHTFWESAKTGIGSATERNGGWKRAGLKAREWVDLRWTQDFTSTTVKYWRAVPFEINDDCEQVDGLWWYPVATTTHADFSGIDSTATSAWWIGLRFTGYLASLKFQNYARSTTYVDINAADLDALSLGASSFTDDAGNTWTSVAGEIVAAP